MHGQRPLACATSLVLEQDSHHQSLEYKSESSLLRLNIITTYKYNNKYENSFAVNQHLKLTYGRHKRSLWKDFSLIARLGKGHSTQEAKHFLAASLA